MKKLYYIFKIIWQIVLYAFELASTSLFFTWISIFICSIDSTWGYIERFLICYTMYQLLVVVILNTLNDIERDSCLAYLTLLKKVLLFLDTNNKMIKDEIVDKINYQLDVGTMNNLNYRNSYELLLSYIENNKKIDRTYVENEIISVEHIYEFISLQWRYSFLLRLFKNRNLT